MAGLASISLQPSLSSSHIFLSSTAREYGSSCFVAFTSPLGGSTPQHRRARRLHSERVPIGLKIQSAATKPAKSPGTLSCNLSSS